MFSVQRQLLSYGRDENRRGREYTNFDYGIMKDLTDKHKTVGGQRDLNNLSKKLLTGNNVPNQVDFKQLATNILTDENLLGIIKNSDSLDTYIAFKENEGKIVTARKKYIELSNKIKYHSKMCAIFRDKYLKAVSISNIPRHQARIGEIAMFEKRSTYKKRFNEHLQAFTKAIRSMKNFDMDHKVNIDMRTNVEKSYDKETDPTDEDNINFRVNRAQLGTGVQIPVPREGTENIPNLAGIRNGFDVNNPDVYQNILATVRGMNQNAFNVFMNNIKNGLKN